MRVPSARRTARVMLALGAPLAVVPALPQLDPLSQLFAGVVSILSSLATLLSAGAFSPEWAQAEAPWSVKPAYFMLLGAFWSSMLLVAMADNFAILWMGIAATTFATAFLVGFAGDATALEAAWKYLVLCGIGIVVAFVGILLMARAGLEAGLPGTAALVWTSLATQHLPPALARLGCALALAGLATKAGLAPMHTWLPDAHSKAPAPVSALLSGVLVSCALYGVMRVEQVAAGQGALSVAQTLLLTLGALSTVVAGALMLAQRDLKRLLAYSTVEHVGIVALALGFGGALGFLAAILHVVNHAFAKTLAFFAAGAVQHERNTTKLSALRGLWVSGGAGKLLLGATVALTGLPPFGLFVSELLVVLAGIASHRWLALGVGLLGITLATAGMVRATVEVESGPAPQQSKSPPSRLAGYAGVAGLAGLAAVSILPWTPAGAVLRAAAAFIAVPK